MPTFKHWCCVHVFTSDGWTHLLHCFLRDSTLEVPKPSHFPAYRILAIQWPSHICSQLLIANSSLLQKMQRKGINRRSPQQRSTANILCHITDCKGSYKEIPWRLLVYRPVYFERQTVRNPTVSSVFSVSLRRYDTFLQRSALTLPFFHHSSSQSSSVNPSNVTQPFSEVKHGVHLDCNQTCAFLMLARVWNHTWTHL